MSQNSKIQDLFDDHIRNGFVGVDHMKFYRPNRRNNMDSDVNVNEKDLPENVVQQMEEYKQNMQDNSETVHETRKFHDNKLNHVSSRIHVSKQTCYLLTQQDILKHIIGNFKEYMPFKINVMSKNNSYTVECNNDKCVKEIKQYISKHIQNNIKSIQCGIKKVGVIGPGGIFIKAIKYQSKCSYIWNDNVTPGLINIYDYNINHVNKAFKLIEDKIDNITILSLNIGQYGLLIMDNAYWLNIIRQNSGSFIVGLDPTPHATIKRDMYLNRYNSIDSNENISDEYDNDNETKCRLLISGDNTEIIQNALQLFYEYMYNCEQKIIDRSEFNGIIGRNHKVIKAIINEVETSYIANRKFERYFTKEEIIMKDKNDPNWVESLRLSIFDNKIDHSIWIHGPKFMREAINNYINSVIMEKRFLSFSHLEVNKPMIMVILHVIKPVLLGHFGVKYKIVFKMNDDDDFKDYIVFEVSDRNNKINVNGIRMMLHEYMDGSTMINIEKYKDIFTSHFKDILWSKLAYKCNVKILCHNYDDLNILCDNLNTINEDTNNNENNGFKKIIIIGNKNDVEIYQEKLVKIIKLFDQSKVLPTQDEINSYLEL